MTDISGGQMRPRQVTERPEALLKATQRDIEHATFVGKGDQPKVQLMLAELEWTMRTAFDQLLEVLTENEAEPDPSTVRRGHGLLGSEPELLGVEMASMHGVGASAKA